MYLHLNVRIIEAIGLYINIMTEQREMIHLYTGKRLSFHSVCLTVKVAKEFFE